MTAKTPVIMVLPKDIRASVGIKASTFADKSCL
jgi:hypothetical protein